MLKYYKGAIIGLTNFLIYRKGKKRFSNSIIKHVIKLNISKRGKCMINLFSNYVKTKLYQNIGRLLNVAREFYQKTFVVKCYKKLRSMFTENKMCVKDWASEW